jgi:hypothetical protein
VSDRVANTQWILIRVRALMTVANRSQHPQLSTTERASTRQMRMSSGVDAGSYLTPRAPSGLLACTKDCRDEDQHGPDRLNDVDG